MVQQVPKEEAVAETIVSRSRLVILVVVFFVAGVMCDVMYSLALLCYFPQLK